MPEIDQEWLATVSRKAKMREDSLNEQLNSSRSSTIKESIRMSLNDLGDLHVTMGDVQQALRLYFKTRDNCTTPKHIIQMVTIGMTLAS